MPGQGKDEVRWKHLAVEKVRKWAKSDSESCHRSQLKGVPTAKSGTIDQKKFFKNN